MDQRRVIYCVVPEELSGELLGELRAHFAGDDRVHVMVERRKRERRASARGGMPSRSAAEELADRRIGSDRRRPVLPRMLDTLPPELAARASVVKFFQRMLPVSESLTSLDVRDVVARVREGDPEAPTELYWRVYERIHSRLCVLLGDVASADRAAPGAFGRVLDLLDDPAHARTAFDPLLYDAVQSAVSAMPAAAADEAPVEGTSGPTLAISDPSLDEPVSVRERDPSWFGRAQDERAKIVRLAGSSFIALEHIGSTGVPAIGARPIVDLMIGVERMQEPAELRKALLGLGYVRCGNAGTRGRGYYRKRGVLEFDVHVVRYDGPLWRDAIDFREFLRRSPTEAARWASAKREAARAGGHSLLKYSELRAPALREIRSRAGQTSQRAA